VVYQRALIDSRIVNKVDGYLLYKTVSCWLEGFNSGFICQESCLDEHQNFDVSFSL